MAVFFLLLLFKLLTANKLNVFVWTSCFAFSDFKSNMLRKNRTQQNIPSEFCREVLFTALIET